VTDERVPDKQAIAARAYAIYEARGKADGHDKEDWHKAEAELAIEAGGPADAGPNVPVQSGGRGERADEVMPDVEEPRPGERPEQLQPPGVE
jgi:hypothetical protein